MNLSRNRESLLHSIKEYLATSSEEEFLKIKKLSGSLIRGEKSKLLNFIDLKEKGEMEEAKRKLVSLLYSISFWEGFNFNRG